MRLGDGFFIPVVEEPVVEEPRQPTFEDLRNEQLLVAIAALQDALTNMPRPEVHVEAPDLSAIVTAVTGLKPGATSEDIAQAVVRELNPATPQTEINEVLAKLVKALERLDFRMQGSGTGGSVALASSNITDNPTRQLGVLNHTNDRPLPVDIRGAQVVGGSFTPTPSVSSTKNLPTTPLAANEQYVGEWEDVLQFAAIQVAVFTDAPSAANGAVIEFSADMVNVVRGVPTTIPANFGAYFHLSPEARYVRLRYQNGPTAQTMLRLSVQFSYTTPSEVVQPLASTITDANVATVVKSHLAGRQATGQWSPVAVSSTGRLSVDTSLVIPTPQTDALTDVQLRAKFLRTATRLAYHAGLDGGRSAYNSSTDLLSFTGGTQQSFCALVNPAGSGVDLHIHEFKQSASAATVTRRLRNATVTATGAALTNVNRGGGSSTGAGRFYAAGAFTYAGGVVGQVQHLAANGSPSDQPAGSIILRPGMSLVWTIQAPGASAVTTYTATMEPIWHERAAEA